MCCELRAVVRTDEVRSSPLHEQGGQEIDYVVRCQSAFNSDRQAFPGELIDDIQHPYRFAIAGPVGDKIIRPDMIPVQRTKPYAGTIVEPQPPAFTLFLWYFESFLVPDPLDALVVD